MFIARQETSKNYSWLSLHMSQVANQAEAYPGFYSVKQLGIFPIPPKGMLVHHSVTPLNMP